MASLNEYVTVRHSVRYIGHSTLLSHTTLTLLSILFNLQGFLLVVLLLLFVLLVLLVRLLVIFLPSHALHASN